MVMKRILSAALVALSLIALAACAPKAQYHLISAEEAKERLDSGDALVLVDVRTKEEFDAGHIESALLLPNEEILDSPPEILPDKNAEILIYCRSGNRSAQAAKKLVAMGYTNVYDFGGIIDWPYDVIESSG